MGDFAAALRRNAEDGGRDLPGPLSQRLGERPAWLRREASPVEVAPAPAPADPEPRSEWFGRVEKSEPAPEPDRLLPNLGTESEQLLRDVLGENAPPRPARRAAAPPSGRRPPRALAKVMRVSVAAAGVVVAVLAGFLSANRAVQEKMASTPSAAAPATQKSAPLFSFEPLAPGATEPLAEDQIPLFTFEAFTPAEAKLRLEQATAAESSDLRAAAIAEIALDGSEDVRGALRNLLHSETDAEVRAELYSALAFDAGETFKTASPADLAEMSLVEEKPEARVQGFRLVASMLRFDSDGKLAKTFDDSMVPWLKHEALNEGSRYSQLVAVDALKLASTYAATEALHDISRSPETQVAEAADRALFAQTRLR